MYTLSVQHMQYSCTAAAGGRSSTCLGVVTYALTSDQQYMTNWVCERQQTLCEGGGAGVV